METGFTCTETARFGGGGGGGVLHWEWEIPQIADRIKKDQPLFPGAQSIISEFMMSFYE